MRGLHEVSVVAALLAAATAGAQAPAGPRPVARAAETRTPPLIDGDVLGDPAWQAAEPLDRFWQTTPDAGQPASERTEVRILYTRDTLYFGVVCHDREAQRLVVNESRRDSSLDNTDSFQIVLDTYRDRQNGFVFGTNPAGLEYDGQVTNEGQGGGDRSSLGGFNLNWDGSWQVRARVGDFGWSAEFAIPFRTLRYGRGDAQTWGLNLQRNIRRRNERAYWSPLERQHGLYRLSAAGTLERLGVPPQRNLQYNDRIDNWSTNLRLGWLHSANTGLFVVYNENRETGEWGVRDRSLTLKLSRLFDVLK